MNKKWYGVFSGLTIGLLACGGICSVVTGHHSFSANENRYLTQFPSISLSGLLSGETQMELTEAINDQFPARDYWTETATLLKKCVGYQDAGGVYIGKEHYYFSKVMNQDISQTNYFQNLRFIRLASQIIPECPVYTLLVPSPGTILTDKLPSHASLYDSNKMYEEAQSLLDGVQVIDMRSAMKKEAGEQQVYYRTDHHWTAAGAYVGYKEICEVLQLKSREYKEYQVRAVSDHFYGTLYSKVLDNSAIPDELEAPSVVPDTAVDSDGTKGNLFVPSQAEQNQKDKYAYFFGGNYGKVTIKTESDSKRKLLIVKDSFANSLVPYLLEDFQEITMVDLRYLKESFHEMVQEYKPDQMLFLYEMSNFAQDDNLNKMIK